MVTSEVMSPDMFPLVITGWGEYRGLDDICALDKVRLWLSYYMCHTVTIPLTFTEITWIIRYVLYEALTNSS